MSCPVCGGRTVSFAVPAALRSHAPESGADAALCTTCLRTVPADGSDDASLDAVAPAFPTGEAGAALALALGHLDSLALERDAIDDCCSYAERAGTDALLTLDRLADEPDVDPHFDIDRRRPQLAEMLE
ncbi:DUF6276 family protein [Haloplanus halobius]|uniref:DUF6276 family protein n=1 Tax=Haloplanus halobius TaxID=2934938 RepID=UPI002010865E|nr:DUF6276 family protein [Haloplanus sp. XH21]